ncbi:MAG TPA: metabolite traffic protein EboE [Planctomycetota bacterium]|nr:metabolite traffic protein EboE [Planctomycetota bacterium]
MRFKSHGREAYLSYSTNVHPAETMDELIAVLREQVAPISRQAFGNDWAAVNLRLGMKQVDALLSHPALPSTSYLSDDILKAPPSPACEKFLAALDDLKLDVVSINAFPIRDFHAPRVKEQVYSPPWTDGGRALYSLKIAKALTHFMARPEIERAQAAISVPSGVFKGLYGDAEEVKTQCAHFITECVRELLRLERLTGRRVVLGFEPEPATTGETIPEFIEYFKLIVADARQKFPLQLGITRERAEELVRTFVTVNMDLCHQAVEFEDPLEELKRLQAAGISVSGLHLSAAVKLTEPAKNSGDFERFKALDEPRYLHQVVARHRDGRLSRYDDIPLFVKPRRGAVNLDDITELRCHFHVPLFAELSGALTTTRVTVEPAVRYALEKGITDNFVAETYTWHVLSALASSGNEAARSVVGQDGKIDVRAGIVRELQWARGIMGI